MEIYLRIVESGLDLSVNWQMSESIGSGLSYEYVRAEFEEGDYSDRKYLWFLKAYQVVFRSKPC